MNLLYLCQNNDKETDENARKCAVANKCSKLHKEHSDAHGKGEQYTMDKMSVNLQEAANYLIQLFYQTGKRYTCGRTKLGKLLSIVAFKYAREDKQLFDEMIYRYDGCGTFINELNSYNRDIYFCLDCEDEKEEYLDEVKTRNEFEFDRLVEIPEEYKKIDTLYIDVKETIMEVFQEFGFYTAAELGQQLRCIVEDLKISDENGRVDLQKVRDLQIEEIPVEFLKEKIILFLLK